jgi:hypothetical protein
MIILLYPFDSFRSYSVVTATFLEKSFNILKNIFMGTDDLSLAIQHHGDREDQEVTIHNGEGIKHQVAETDNSHGGEDSKMTFNRNNSNRDLSSHKGSVGVCQETRKPDGRTRKDRLPTNT